MHGARPAAEKPRGAAIQVTVGREAAARRARQRVSAGRREARRQRARWGCGGGRRAAVDAGSSLGPVNTTELTAPGCIRDAPQGAARRSGYSPEQGLQRRGAPEDTPARRVSTQNG